MAKRLPVLVVFSFLFTMLASPAWAIKDPETGVSFPNQIKCDGEQAKAAGVGVREATFGVDVYAVVVYVSPKAKGKSIRGTGECVMIHAKFVRDVGLDKIKEAWNKSFKKYGVGGAKVKKFMGIIKKEMKKHGNMMMVVHGDKVVHKYMGASVTIKGAKKLGTVIKKVYLGGGSPTPKLIKDVKKRGFAKP
jgi:hypothetical protein